MSKFLKRLPAKLWMIVCAAVTLAFFANDFGLVDLQKTALVLAAGIDRDGEEFSLTAQIAVPKGTDRTTGGTSSVEIEGRGVWTIFCATSTFPTPAFWRRARAARRSSSPPRAPSTTRPPSPF